MNDRRPDSAGLPEALKRELDGFLPTTEGPEDEIDRVPYEAVAGYVQELLAERGEGHREIDTWTGQKIIPADPDPEKIKLDDIAHGLSNLGRFAGQGPSMYSVARHSVHVSLEVEARGGSLAAQRWGLLHDGAEAYLSDVPGPVKKSLPGYKNVEKRLDEAILTAIGLDLTEDEKELVHDIADKVVGKHELSVQFPEGGHEEPGDLRHDPDTVDSGEDDKELFVSRACALGLQ